jgi:hypothetical protein
MVVLFPVSDMALLLVVTGPLLCTQELHPEMPATAKVAAAPPTNCRLVERVPFVDGAISDLPLEHRSLFVIARVMGLCHLQPLSFREITTLP